MSLFEPRPLFIPADYRPVWRVLQDHVGKANAISQADLAAATELPPRQVRQIVRDLVVTCRRPICSSYGGGYYLTANDNEAQEAAEGLRAHALKMLIRASVLNKTSLEMEITRLAGMGREEQV